VKDSESMAQLPLPEAGEGRVIKLPLPAGIGPRSQPQTPDQAESAPRHRGKLWYALFLPQLATLSEPHQERVLRQLAALVESVSSTVSFHPQALICEVRSSLRYFGGIEVIHDRLQSLITPALQDMELPNHFLYAASPTVTGSLLLARSGQNLLVYRKENLRSALGQLPTEVLQLNKEQNRRLYNMGVRKLRDIWRLPADGLHKRFGSDFIRLLNRALGTVAEPTHNYLPPPAFTSSYDLPYELENLDRLLPVADEMLAQLCDFLRQRDLSASHLVFSLLHERREASEIDMALRQASRCRDHLLLLLETHFGNLSLPAPVTGVRLHIKQFDAFMSESESLLLQDKAIPTTASNSLDQFMEQLQARLGGQTLKSINTIAEHCPEYACEELDYEQARKTRGTRKAGKIEAGGRSKQDVAKKLTLVTRQQQLPSALVADNPRPLWLLDDPVELTRRGSRLYYRKPVSLISGPERIETCWWTGADVNRDYYVAQESSGSRLWVYRERSGERRWYLHGFFA